MARNRRRWGAGIAVFAFVLAGVVVWRAPEVDAWLWYLREGKPTIISGRPSLVDKLRWFDDYYIVADLGQNAFAIGEPLYGQCNFSYLIVGSKRALLFDAGSAIRNIVPAVRALTPLPVVALPSHLHFDHVGNLERFDDVALPDLPALRRQLHDGLFSFGFYQFLGFTEGFKPKDVRVTRWIAPGSDIDLGDRKLTLIGVPGHTPDSVAVLDRRANRLFTGDFIYPSEIYAFLPGANLGDYHASTQRVVHLLNDDSIVYGAHGCDHLPLVDLPKLRRADVAALGGALASADTVSLTAGTGWYPREFAVNERMKLLAKYPWMRP